MVSPEKAPLLHLQHVPEIIFLGMMIVVLVGQQLNFSTFVFFLVFFPS